MAKSKPRAARGKAPKPDWRKRLGVHPDFPLFPHSAGYWAKKVRGKLYYFGKVADDPKGQAALLEWDRVKEARLSGREPRAKVDGVTVSELCDRFLQAKEQLVASKEITLKTWSDYKRVTDRVVKHFGKGRVVADLTADDFAGLRAEFSKSNGPVSLGNFIQRVRVAFKYAYDADLIPEPVKYGPMFKRPSKKALRIQRSKTAAKLFTADDVRLLIDGATPQLKAMILLAVNAGLGNNDCATLERRHLDLESGWLDFARAKTDTMRRCPLWPETITALDAVLASRKPPKDKADADLVFVTKYGSGWASHDSHDSPVAKEFAKLAKRLKLQQPGRGFYSLRHTHRTVAGGAKDLEATRAIMGHVNDHVEDAYIETLPEDDRLRAVADHVRAWLYGRKPADHTGGSMAKRPAGQAPHTIKMEPRRRQASAELAELKAFIG
jgi:integrase